MFKLKSFRLLWFVFVIYAQSFGYNSLRVGNPDSWWMRQGTIDEAIVSIKQQGLYTEIGLYLTFSAQGWGYTSAETLEVELQFELPAGAIVHDSWLWIGDDIIRAQIMDRWTASQIYEDIVDRRRDPSILFKNSPTQYELRIYPMAGTDSRKVKISYLVPSQWSSNSVYTVLPTNLLQTSRYPVETFHILSWIDGEWTNPGISEFSDIQFESLSDQVFGDYLRADVPNESITGPLNYSLDAPYKNGVYLERFESASENIYQVAFLPSEALDIASSKKVAILFDYAASNGSIEPAETLNNAKLALMATCTQSDSFNLIFSQLNIQRVSEDWIPADSNSIETVFANLGGNPISNYSNLPGLLANGIDFVQSHGSDGSILLVSNSGQVGDNNTANPLIDDLLELMNPIFPIHVANYQEANFQYHWIGGRYYYGNEYFYSNIARMTSGNYLDLWDESSLSDMLLNLFQQLGGFMSSFDLATSFDGGYCYGRYTLNQNLTTVYLNRPILQIGKYFGDYPFRIQAAGMLNSDLVFQTMEIPLDDSHVSDSLAQEAWAGNYIQALEISEQSNDIVGEIVQMSIDERILSKYTAFLCLEPAQGGEICHDCVDETELITALAEDSTSVDSLQILSFPNPFNASTTISITLADKDELSDYSFAVFNILGQKIRTFNTSQLNSSKQLQFVWNGQNDAGQALPSGTYFFVSSSPRSRFTQKLILLK